MYLVRLKGLCYDRTSEEILAETQKEIIKLLEKFNEEGKILKEVVEVPDCLTAKEYLKETEKPEDLVCGKKGGK